MHEAKLNGNALIIIHFTIISARKLIKFLKIPLRYFDCNIQRKQMNYSVIPQVAIKMEMWKLWIKQNWKGIFV